MASNLNKKQLYKETFILTVLIIFITLVLQYFPLNFEIAKPIKEEFSDFDVYDIIYSGENVNNHTRDSNIIIVQAGDSRKEIADEIALIEKYHPSVIGIDLMFLGNSDNWYADSLLQQNISMPNIVVANRFENVSDEPKTIIQNFFHASLDSNNSGYINFAGDEISVVRYYPPFRLINQKLESAFTSLIAKKYNISAYNKLKNNYQKLQIINYSNNIEGYTSFLNGHFDTAQFGETIKNKIVLLGVLHKSFPLVLEDLHFTPLNNRTNGKSFPDMYGVVIHANILSMILSSSYIVSVPRTWSYVIAILFTLLLVHYQLKPHYLGKHPSDLWFFLIQFLIIVILVFIFLCIYKLFHYKFALFPIVMPIVLCIEIIEVYKFLIKRFLKKFNYKSIYLKKD